MTASPAPPETKRGVKLDELPVAQTELEPPYRVLVHNKDVTSRIQIYFVLCVAAAAEGDNTR